MVREPGIIIQLPVKDSGLRRMEEASHILRMPAQKQRELMLSYEEDILVSIHSLKRNLSKRSSKHSVYFKVFARSILFSSYLKTSTNTNQDRRPCVYRTILTLHLLGYMIKQRPSRYTLKCIEITI